MINFKKVIFLLSFIILSQTLAEASLASTAKVINSPPISKTKTTIDTPSTTNVGGSTIQSGGSGTIHHTPYSSPPSNLTPVGGVTITSPVSAHGAGSFVTTPGAFNQNTTIRIGGGNADLSEQSQTTRASVSLSKNVAKGTPFGFKNAGEFRQFGKTLNAGLADAGFSRTKAILQGSAVTGKNFRTGKAFDAGKVSDFDIALAGPDIFARARQLGIRLRSSGTRTGPLTGTQIQQLGLGPLRNSLSQSAKRPVKFMVFSDAKAAAAKAPSVGF